MKLSKDFNLDEFVISQAAARNGISNEPDAHIIGRLKELCDTILQPLRNFYGKPIIISSGYRCKEVNKIIGSSDSSQHIKGEAADLHINGVTIDEIAEAIQKLKLPFHQLILEFGRWIHVSISHEGQPPRKQVLIATRQDGKVKYTEIRRG